MIACISEELILRKKYLFDQPLGSIYFGGGTPSILTGTELGSIFGAIRDHFILLENAEVTLEANPDDITEDSLRIWKENGINRLSIGIQSFNDEELKWMNRGHSAHDAVAAVELSKKGGFDDISVDLIYGSKFQTSDSWKRTVEKALDLNVPHISAYHLTVEKGTALGVKNRKRAEPDVSPELGREQFLFISSVLEQNGYEHYEISNFARSGYKAVHNSSYWKGEPYLGIGPSAHSFNGIERRWNVSNNALYVKNMEEGNFYFDSEILSLHDRYNEYILTGLRTSVGCDTAFIEKEFGKDLLIHFQKNAEKYRHLFQQHMKNHSLTKEGWLLSDAIASDLFTV